MWGRGKSKFSYSSKMRLSLESLLQKWIPPTSANNPFIYCIHLVWKYESVSDGLGSFWVLNPLPSWMKNENEERKKGKIEGFGSFHCYEHPGCHFRFPTGMNEIRLGSMRSEVMRRKIVTNFGYKVPYREIFFCRITSFVEWSVVIVRRQLRLVLLRIFIIIGSWKIKTVLGREGSCFPYHLAGCW